MSQAVPLNTDKFKLAAPGAGVVVYQRLSKRKMRVMLSMRVKDVGPGLGITSGGFVECIDIDSSPVGTVVQTADEAYRESRQENGGFEKVITLDDFLERAQPVTTINVRTEDESRVHAVTMYALGVKDDAEWEAFAALPPGVDEHGRIEREGPLLEVILTWDSSISRRTPEKVVVFSGPDGVLVNVATFFHQHEVHGIATIAWHDEQGKLWS